VKKIFCSILLISVCGVSSFSATRYQEKRQSETPKKPEYNEPLRQELFAMTRAAQRVRQRAVGAKFEDEKFNKELDEVDGRNTERLKAIIKENGWFTIDTIGIDGLRIAFLLITQSPSLEFQKEMLPNLKASADRGELAMEAYATLADRILLKEGKAQIYGTQAQFIEGKVVISPTEDIAHVDERRHKLGMPPLADYIKALENYHRMAAEREKKAAPKN